MLPTTSVAAISLYLRAKWRERCKRDDWRFDETVRWVSAELWRKRGESARVEIKLKKMPVSLYGSQDCCYLRSREKTSQIAKHLACYILAVLYSYRSTLRLSCILLVHKKRPCLYASVAPSRRQIVKPSTVASKMQDL